MTMLRFTEQPDHIPVWKDQLTRNKEIIWPSSDLEMSVIFTLQHPSAEKRSWNFMPRGDGSLGQYSIISLDYWLSEKSSFPYPNILLLTYCFLACPVANRMSLYLVTILVTHPESIACDQPPAGSPQDSSSKSWGVVGSGQGSGTVFPGDLLCDFLELLADPVLGPGGRPLRVHWIESRMSHSVCSTGKFLPIHLDFFLGRSHIVSFCVRYPVGEGNSCWTSQFIWIWSVCCCCFGNFRQHWLCSICFIKGSCLQVGTLMLSL